ncbi:MAG: hypothetical protein EHM21_13270, partial [Chloroflexi bacterium]
MKEPVWLALKNENPGEPWLIGSIPTETGVQWIRLEDFYETSGPPLWLNAEVTGDGTVDVALAFPSREVRDCKVGEDGYKVFIAGRVSAQADVYASSTI